MMHHSTVILKFMHVQERFREPAKHLSVRVRHDTCESGRGESALVLSRVAGPLPSG